jgi:hypothetical protein
MRLTTRSSCGYNRRRQSFQSYAKNQATLESKRLTVQPPIFRPFIGTRFGTATPLVERSPHTFSLVGSSCIISCFGDGPPGLTSRNL